MGRIGVRRLGLSEARTRELRLVRAWGRVARGLAARFPPRVRHGVLEVSAPDATWERALRTLMPRLAARLARDEPALELRSYRLDGPDGRGAVSPIDPADAGSDPAPGLAPQGGVIESGAPSSGETVPGEAEALEVRLARVRDRYIERRR